MFVAGYQFYVLTPIFTIHWILQNKKSRPSWREHQNNVNRKQFEIFKRELFARYKGKDPLNLLNTQKRMKNANSIKENNNNKINGLRVG
jgi:N-acetyllactosaminide beta-1,3-N-acetylglucosaminyltransferase